MNKYLMTRMEKAHLNPRIENLIFLTFEAFQLEYLNLAFQEFCSQTPGEIAKILGWCEDKKILDLIEDGINDKSLIFHLIQQDRDGFLAKVKYQGMRNIEFKENKIYSWSSVEEYNVHWIYAHTVGELVEKILKVDEEEYQNMITEAWKKLETEKSEEKVV